MLYLLTALPAEARPLRAALRLEARAEAGPFHHFVGDGVELVAAGVGRVAMAAACGWLAARATAPGLWLNVGIAGHRELAPGSVFLAAKVIERATRQTFYPPLLFVPPCATLTLETVDRPELDYPEPHGYDMEASAFLAVAQRVAGAELAQVLKVASDRSRLEIAELAAAGPARVEKLIEGALPQVMALREVFAPILATARAGEEEPAFFAELLEGRHFTFSDRVELRRLLRRLAALAPEAELPARVREASRGRELNRRLAVWLEVMPVVYGGGA